MSNEMNSVVRFTGSDYDLYGSSDDILCPPNFLYTIAVATGNVHKVAEITNALSVAQDSPLCGIHFKTIRELCPDFVDPVEDGGSFEDNAAIKAHAAHYVADKPALADDSGLVVDALGGAPGIYSARYSGFEHHDAANNEKLLYELEGIPEERRRARFVCCLVVVGLNRIINRPGFGYLTVTGTCEGTIATEPRGDNGFGYDPLFLPDATPGRSMAQLTLEEKTAISHRGVALRKLLARLRDAA